MKKPSTTAATTDPRCPSRRLTARSEDAAPMQEMVDYCEQDVSVPCAIAQAAASAVG